MSPDVLFENVFLNIDGKSILKDVSFSVERGTCVLLIGPNGGGKTSLLRLIAGLLKPTAGRIRYAGGDKPSSCFCTLVPQHWKVDKQFPITALDVVLGGRVHTLSWWGSFTEKDRGLALDALDKVGLLAKKDTLFSCLSGGQMQRVLLARALACNSHVLLLDEATSQMDKNSKETVIQLVKDLLPHMTVFWVTHEAHALLPLAQKVFCIQETLQVIPPNELCKHYDYGVFHTREETE